MRLAIIVVLSSSLLACHGELVPLDDGETPSVDGGGGGASTWEGGVAARLARCTGCHGSAGDYSLESYQDSLGCGTDDVPNIVPGDASSELIAFCASGHGGGMPATDVAAIERWILDGAAER